MEDLKLERVGTIEVAGKLDEDGECCICTEGSAFLDKEEIQQVIDHLTLLLKG